MLTIKHIHIIKNDNDEILSLLKIIYEQNKKIIMTQQELTQIINAITAQVGKIKEESTATLAKLSELQEIINNQGGVSPELQAAVDALKAQVQVVDDLVADAPVVPPIDGNVNAPD